MVTRLVILVLASSLMLLIKVNTVLTNLNLRDNNIGASGAGSLSDAI